MKPFVIVLVRSKYPRNVGMISRIMCNFGIQRLVLVDPQCEMNEQARQGAAQGQKPLSEVTIYNTWDDFYREENEGPRIAFSRRKGKRRPSIPLKETLQLEILNTAQPTYLIFGAEDHGLSSEDLEKVHRVCHFELPGELHSMNLSHAALLAIQAFTSHFVETTTAPLKAEPIKTPTDSLRQWLEALDFDLESQKRWNALVMLNQMIMKAAPSHEEVHQLDMIIQQTIRRIDKPSAPHNP